MARGPSYTDEEQSALKRLAGNGKLSLDEKVEEFVTQFDGRTRDAVSQKLRKMQAENAAAAPKTATGGAVRRKRGRPPKTSVAAAPAAPAAAVNGHVNGNGKGPSITVDLQGVMLTGHPQKIGQLLVQLSAA